ncbi:hypothetical protein B0H14DRAFT_2633005 [Mycena olivaceomarginata]|nr:hypothetical protein B0H14DRAFT_2633005 [Mycena olivaceomarginata]
MSSGRGLTQYVDDESRRKLKHLIQDESEHELQAWKKEIASRTSTLQAQIASFRQDQKYYMVKVGDEVAAQTVAGIVTQDESLYRPGTIYWLERIRPRWTGRNRRTGSLLGRFDRVLALRSYKMYLAYFGGIWELGQCWCESPGLRSARDTRGGAATLSRRLRSIQDPEYGDVNKKNAA